MSEPDWLKRVFSGDDFIEPPTMNLNTIEQIIEQTGWVKGEPIEDLRGRLEKIGELVAPYCKVPAYKFTPAPPMDRRKMLFGGSGSSIEERIDELAEKFYTLRYEGESTAYVKTKSFMRSALAELAADLQAEKEKEVAELNDRISWLETQREVECQQKRDAQKESEGFSKEAAELRAASEERLKRYMKCLTILRNARHAMTREAWQDGPTENDVLVHINAMISEYEQEQEITRLGGSHE